jgi:hypothetical protein
MAFGSLYASLAQKDVMLQQKSTELATNYREKGSELDCRKTSQRTRRSGKAPKPVSS